MKLIEYLNQQEKWIMDNPGDMTNNYCIGYRDGYAYFAARLIELIRSSDFEDVIPKKSKKLSEKEEWKIIWNNFFDKEKQ